MKTELEEILSIREEIKKKTGIKFCKKINQTHKSDEDLMYNLASIVYQMDDKLKEYFITLFTTFFVSKGFREEDFEAVVDDFEKEVNELYKLVY